MENLETGPEAKVQAAESPIRIFPDQNPIKPCLAISGFSKLSEAKNSNFSNLPIVPNNSYLGFISMILTKPIFRVTMKSEHEFCTLKTKYSHSLQQSPEHILKREGRLKMTKLESAKVTLAKKQQEVKDLATKVKDEEKQEQESQKLEAKLIEAHSAIGEAVGKVLADLGIELPPDRHIDITRSGDGFNVDIVKVKTFRQVASVRQTIKLPDGTSTSWAQVCRDNNVDYGVGSPHAAVHKAMKDTPELKTLHDSIAHEEPEGLK